MTKAENLFKMAEKAYIGKNYAEAENLCVEVLSLDGENYEAWKLKGMIASSRTTLSHSTLFEVFECFMTAYRISAESEKAKCGEEILMLLKTAIDTEVTFYFLQFQNNRPIESVFDAIVNTYKMAVKMLKNAYLEIGMSGCNDYIDQFTTLWIAKSTVSCLYSWEKVVAYNYYRESYKEEFALYRDTYDVSWNDEEYRPNTDTLRLFISETDILIKLSLFAIGLKTPNITAEAMLTPCQNIVIFNRHLLLAKSYKLQYSEAQQKIVWRIDSNGLTAEAVQNRVGIIEKYRNKLDDFNVEIAASSPEHKEKIVKEYTDKINSLITVRKIDSSRLVGGIFLMLLALGGFFWGINVFEDIWKIILFLLSAIFFISGVRCSLNRYPSAETVKRNIAEKQRLQATLMKILGEKAGEEYRQQHERKMLEEKNRGERKNKKKVAIILVVALVLIGFVGYTIYQQTYGAQKELYNQAIALGESGEYWDAIQIFEDLGEFKDSAQKIVYYQNMWVYENGIANLEAGNYKAANEAFWKLEAGFKDSEDYITYTEAAMLEMYQAESLYRSLPAEFLDVRETLEFLDANRKWNGIKYYCHTYDNKKYEDNVAAIHFYRRADGEVRVQISAYRSGESEYEKYGIHQNVSLDTVITDNYRVKDTTGDSFAIITSKTIKVENYYGKYGPRMFTAE